MPLFYADNAQKVQVIHDGTTIDIIDARLGDRIRPGWHVLVGVQDFRGG